MRRRKAQLLGLGHPLVDALVAHLQSAAFQGDVSCLLRDDEGEPDYLCVFSFTYILKTDDTRSSTSITS